MKNTLYYGDNLTIKELLDGKEFDFPKGWSLRSGSGKKLVRDGTQGALEM